jgi:hypothetical protein
MLASIFITDLLMWNSRKFSSNIDQDIAESYKPENIEVNYTEQSKFSTPSLSEDIFRDRKQENERNECF